MESRERSGCVVARVTGEPRASVRRVGLNLTVHAQRSVAE